MHSDGGGTETGVSTRDRRRRRGRLRVLRRVASWLLLCGFAARIAAPAAAGEPQPGGAPAGRPRPARPPKITRPDPEPARPTTPARPTAAPAARKAPRASRDTFEDVVALGRGAGWHCSGVLVGPAHVLTARHCLPVDRVLFGRSVLRPAEVVRVARAAAPPDRRLDVAVLTLERPSAVAVRARRAPAAAAPPPATARIVGFGATTSDGREGFGERRTATLPMGSWGCDASRAAAFGCDPDVEAVLVSTAGKDTCDGDSGGPLLERAGGRWRLVGIASRALARARVRCGEGGVYVRVDRIDAWLSRVLAPGARPERGRR